MMSDYIVDFFKFFGLSVGRFNKNSYTKRKNYYKHKTIFEKYKDFTMIPFYNYLDNLSLASVVKNIEGDIVECGVWRGGMIAGIAEVLGNERQYWLFDSFEGLPPAGDKDGEAAFNWQKNKSGKDFFDNCSAEEKFAVEALKKSNVKNYTIVKGWFEKTLPVTPVKKIALLRLDGDWYESTMTCLEKFYNNVVDEGIIIIDDYYFWDGCSSAVTDFFYKYRITDRIHETEHGVAYIFKNKNTRASVY